uniref:Uncharacterized protein n=1 Tax=Arundo donax TaxID=35708 RepID=A0A0A9APS7_ARUDO
MLTRELTSCETIFFAE